MSAIAKMILGIIVFLVGIIVAWIEFEDMKWERREKAEKREKKK